MKRNAEHTLLVLVSFTAANAIACGGIGFRSSGSQDDGGSVYLNRDLSTGKLSQWAHLDYGLGSGLGSNNSGAGFLWYHSNVGGRRAVGMTATPNAHASPARDSDSVYLWEPSYYWNYKPHEIWLRTSVMFPSAATITTAGATGEQPFQPTTGEWNWFLEFHNDSSRCRVALRNSPMSRST